LSRNTRGGGAEPVSLMKHGGGGSKIGQKKCVTDYLNGPL